MMSATLGNFDSRGLLGRELERQSQEIEILRKVAEDANEVIHHFYGHDAEDFQRAAAELETRLKELNDFDLEV